MVERRTLRGSSFLCWKGRKKSKPFFLQSSVTPLRVNNATVVVLLHVIAHPPTHLPQILYVRTVQHTIYYIVDVRVVSGFAKGATWCSEMGFVLSKPFCQLLKIDVKIENVYFVGTF